MNTRRFSWCWNGQQSFGRSPGCSPAVVTKGPGPFAKRFLPAAGPGASPTQGIDAASPSSQITPSYLAAKKRHERKEMLI